LHQPPAAPKRRPNAWQVATAVLALIALGLGIWAISLQRGDDDGSTAQIEELEQQNASLEEQVAALEDDVAELQGKLDDQQQAAEDAARDAEDAAAKAESDLAAAQKRYDEVSRELGAADQTQAESKAELDRLAKEADAARAEAEAAVAAAAGAQATAEARADAEAARADLAEACLASVADILGRVYHAEDPLEGLADAARELEEIAADCAPEP
jgi:chromosome segregation ATPase